MAWSSSISNQKESPPTWAGSPAFITNKLYLGHPRAIRSIVLRWLGIFPCFAQSFHRRMKSALYRTDRNRELIRRFPILHPAKINQFHRRPQLFRERRHCLADPFFPFTLLQPVGRLAFFAAEHVDQRAQL